MEYVMGYMTALVVIAAGFLGIILALIVLEVSKPKFAVALILSLIIIGLGGYYYYVVGQAEKGVPNPNILNSVLKVSTAAPATPAVTLPSSVPMDMIPSVPREQRDRSEAVKPGTTAPQTPPVEVKVRRPRRP